VNPATNKIYVANWGSANLTVIDGATNSTVLVPLRLNPCGLAVNPATNKIYCPTYYDTIFVVDGATNRTTAIPGGQCPVQAVVNPVTNKIYVPNFYGSDVTVIDGATNTTLRVPVGSYPERVAVNPVTNKVYVANSHDNSVTVIDGATNATCTVAAGTSPWDVAVNPVTGIAYAANYGSGDITAIREARWNDTQVRLEAETLPGDTTSEIRPTLSGKAVNRLAPQHNVMMGVLTRVGTAQQSWPWAQITGGSGTDSLTWSFNWETDSLISGENFVCCVPLSMDAAITGTNSAGGSTWSAGNMAVYPIYRMSAAPVGCAEFPSSGNRLARPWLSVTPSLVRRAARIRYSLPRDGDVSLKLYDATGRVARSLFEGRAKAGTQDFDLRASDLPRGVLFLRLEAVGTRLTEKLILE
jgi:YVTN family beta-propeller protein